MRRPTARVVPPIARDCRNRSKTNIGYTSNQAGIAGLIGWCLGCSTRKVSPLLHFNTLNPHVVVDGFPLVIPTRRMEWPAGAGPRIGAVSSFGLSGTNAHVILQEAPVDVGRTPDLRRPCHIVPLSARSDQALQNAAARLSAWVGRAEAGPHLLGDIAFTAGTGRSHFAHRSAVIAPALAADLQQGLERRPRRRHATCCVATLAGRTSRCRVPLTARFAVRGHGPAVVRNADQCSSRARSLR